MINQVFSILFFFIFSFSVIGQDGIHSDSLFVKATIIDNLSGQKIPYATIYNQTTGSGTISNLNGYFSLDHIRINDVVTISFIGYEKKVLVITKSITGNLFMNPKTELLNTVSVFGNKSFLYNLMTDCSNSKHNKNQTAKTYYALKSSVNNYQVELVECYYNGQFSGFNIEKLNLKNGRFALLDFDSRFFTSTESSRALYMHKLFSKNEYFSISPFQLSQKRLRKYYKLSLNSRYVGEDSSTIYVIEFTPRDSLISAFKGKVWIDSLNSKIIKVNLKIRDSKIHPFVAHGNIDSIIQVNMNLTKTFHDINSSSYIKSINFDYEIKYRTRDSTFYKVNTNAILYVYDYSSEFLLPEFKFSDGLYGDYSKINATPYNHFFWNNMDEFSIKEFTKDNSIYVKNKSAITNETIFLENDFLKKGLLEYPYVFWSKNRIKIRKDTIYNETNVNSTPLDRYNLEVQIYLDINQLKDSLNIITTTIFDPYETFFYYPITNHSLAFINMYFDLVEIHRVELEQALLMEKSIEQIKNIYQQKLLDLKVVSRHFFKEVEHGMNKNGMMKWNAFINQKIGIDNILFFNLYID